MKYRTWDFTQDEREIWEKILLTAEALRGAYEAEGNLDIHRASVAEAGFMAEAARAGRTSRYLYHITT